MPETVQVPAVLGLAPTGMEAQVPVVPPDLVFTQERHVSVHPSLQQTPSVQKPEVHSDPLVQVLPLVFPVPHWPFTHW